MRAGGVEESRRYLYGRTDYRVRNISVTLSTNRKTYFFFSTTPIPIKNGKK